MGMVRSINPNREDGSSGRDHEIREEYIGLSAFQEDTPACRKSGKRDGGIARISRVDGDESGQRFGGRAGAG
jgi:hypothetical protein